MAAVSRLSGSVSISGISGNGSYGSQNATSGDASYSYLPTPLERNHRITPTMLSVQHSHGPNEIAAWTKVVRLVVGVTVCLSVCHSFYFRKAYRIQIFSSHLELDRGTDARACRGRDGGVSMALLKQLGLLSPGASLASAAAAPSVARASPRGSFKLSHE